MIARAERPMPAKMRMQELVSHKSFVEKKYECSFSRFLKKEMESYKRNLPRERERPNQPQFSEISHIKLIEPSVCSSDYGSFLNDREMDQSHFEPHLQDKILTSEINRNFGASSQIKEVKSQFRKSKDDQPNNKLKKNPFISAEAKINEEQFKKVEERTFKKGNKQTGISDQVILKKEKMEVVIPIRQANKSEQIKMVEVSKNEQKVIMQVNKKEEQNGIVNGEKKREVTGVVPQRVEQKIENEEEQVIEENGLSYYDLIKKQEQSYLKNLESQEISQMQQCFKQPADQQIQAVQKKEKRGAIEKIEQKQKFIENSQQISGNLAKKSEQVEENKKVDKNKLIDAFGMKNQDNEQVQKQRKQLKQQNKAIEDKQSQQKLVLQTQSHQSSVHQTIIQEKPIQQASEIKQIAQKEKSFQIYPKEKIEVQEEQVQSSQTRQIKEEKPIQIKEKNQIQEQYVQSSETNQIKEEKPQQTHPNEEEIQVQEEQTFNTCQDASISNVQFQSFANNHEQEIQNGKNLTEILQDKVLTQQIQSSNCIIDDGEDDTLQSRVDKLIESFYTIINEEYFCQNCQETQKEKQEIQKENQQLKWKVLHVTQTNDKLRKINFDLEMKVLDLQKKLKEMEEKKEDFGQKKRGSVSGLQRKYSSEFDQNQNDRKTGLKTEKKEVFSPDSEDYQSQKNSSQMESEEKDLNEFEKQDLGQKKGLLKNQLKNGKIEMSESDDDDDE